MTAKINIFVEFAKLLVHFYATNHFLRLAAPIEALARHTRGFGKKNFDSCVEVKDELKAIDVSNTNCDVKGRVGTQREEGKPRWSKNLKTSEKTDAVKPEQKRKPERPKECKKKAPQGSRTGET